MVIDNKNVLAVLPTGYGKSLIYPDLSAAFQLLSPTYNFMDFPGSPGDKKSTVIVISPLNALNRDQIVKMREGGLNASVLRGDRVDTEDGSDDHDVSLDVPVEILSSTHFDLIYTRPEVLVDNKKVSKLLKTLAAFIINIC